MHFPTDLDGKWLIFSYTQSHALTLRVECIQVDVGYHP